MARKKVGLALADHLTDNALGAFRKAHEQLTQANAILEEDKKAREEDAIQWRKDIEAAIARAEESARAQADKLDKNNKVLGKLADLI